LSVTHYNNELAEVVEYDVYEMLDPQCLAEMTPLHKTGICLMSLIYSKEA